MRNRKYKATLSMLTAVILFASGAMASLSLSTRAMFMVDSDSSLTLDGGSGSSSDGGLVVSEGGSSSGDSSDSGALILGESQDGQGGLTTVKDGDLGASSAAGADAPQAAAQNAGGAAAMSSPMPQNAMGPQGFRGPVPDDWQGTVQTLTIGGETKRYLCYNVTQTVDISTGRTVGGFLYMMIYANLAKAKKASGEIDALYLHLADDIESCPIKGQDTSNSNIRYELDLVVDGYSANGNRSFSQMVDTDHTQTFEAYANDLTITFQNMDIRVMDFYGVSYASGNRGAHKTVFRNVNFVGPQAVWTYSCLGTKDGSKLGGVVSMDGTCVFNMEYTGGNNVEELAEAGHLIFEENSQVSIIYPPRTDGKINDRLILDAVDYTANIIVKKNAVVNISDSGNKRPLLGFVVVGKNQCNFVVEEGASFQYTGRAISSGSTVAFDQFTVGDGGSAIFHLLSTAVKMNPNSKIHVGSGGTMIMNGSSVGDLALGNSATFDILKNATAYLYNTSLTVGDNGRINVGDGATLMTYGTSGLFTLGKSAVLNIAENALALFKGYSTGLKLLEYSEIVANNPRYLGFFGNATYAGSSREKLCNIKVKCETLNAWRKDPLNLSGPEISVFRYVGEGEDFLEVDAKSSLPEYFPNGSSTWSEYGQNSGVVLNPVSPFDDSATGHVVGMDTLRIADISKVEYVSSIDNQMTTLTGPSLQGAMRLTGNQFTLTPNKYGAPAGYGPFQERSTVAVYLRAPIPQPLYSLHGRLLYSMARQTVSSAGDFLKLIEVPRLNYGTVAYTGAVKRYPLAADTKLTIFSAAASGFTLTASASSFQNAAGGQLEYSSVGYMDQDGDYHSMMKKGADGNPDPIKIPAEAFQPDSSYSGGNYRSLSLKAGETGANQIVAELNPYEEIDVDTTYTTTIRWTLDPGLF